MHELGAVDLPLCLLDALGALFHAEERHTGKARVCFGKEVALPAPYVEKSRRRIELSEFLEEESSSIVLCRVVLCGGPVRVPVTVPVVHRLAAGPGGHAPGPERSP